MMQRLVSADRVERARRALGVPALGAAQLRVGEPTAVAVAGVRRRGTNEPVEVGDRWHIGSCAKSITATAVGRLVQSGVMAWDQPVSDLVDTMRDSHPGWQQVTLADLLTHRAGVAANLDRPAMVAALAETRTGRDQRAELAERVLRTAPRRPGTFLYSNLGYCLVGAAMEHASGLDYETVVERELFVPLGITTHGYGAPHPNQPWGHAPRWRLFGRGPAIDPTCTGGRNPSDNPVAMTPAGRLHLSLVDWARFIRLFIETGGELIHADTMRRLTSLPPGAATRQAMGWAIPRGRRAQRTVALGQQGSNQRWVATALVSADRRRAALVVTNDGRPRMLPRVAATAAEILTLET